MGLLIILGLLCGGFIIFEVILAIRSGYLK